MTLILLKCLIKVPCHQKKGGGGGLELILSKHSLWYSPTLSRKSDDTALKPAWLCAKNCHQTRDDKNDDKLR